MGKNHRGKGIVSLPFHGRGECPLCKRTGVKVIYELKQEDQTIKVCKICSKPASK